MKQSVSLRHAAALALVGWSLLSPPFSRTEVSGENCAFEIGICFDVSAPLDRWWSQGSFDSAADCKEAKRLKIEEVMNAWEKLRETNPDQRKPQFALKQLELSNLC